MASNKLKTRGQETNVFMTINGALMTGSFTDVLNFDLKPLIDHQELSFLGETSDQYDMQVNGYEFTMDLNEEDNSVVDQLLMPIVAALDSGSALPVINFTVIKPYRGANVSGSTQLLLNCTLKPDSFTASGRKDFSKMTLSGRCRKVETSSF